MGLRTTQTLSRVNAENVANSTTGGYARRRASVITAEGASSGPVLVEIRREVDLALQRMSRNEAGKMAKRQAIFDGLNNYTVYLGQFGDGVSPAEKFSTFNTSLTTLVNSPASNEAQYGVLLAAEDLARSLREASNVLSAVRSDVDMEIRYEVSELNQTLYELASLNKHLTEMTARTPEAAQLGDRMDSLVDKVAGIVDVRTYSNSDGTLNIYTSGGAALLERGQVQDVVFDAATSSIFAGSVDITPTKPGIRGIAEGSLAGLLELRRDIIPRFQLQLDEYARGLITGFETADETLSPGQPGLFTDAGAYFDPANLENLAFRILVNPAAQPVLGGDVWRLRDGLGATVPGDASDNSQIQRFLDALTEPVSADARTGITGSVTLAEFGAQIVSAQGLERARSQEKALMARSSLEIISASRANFEGVNIDEEMQDLQVIQQSYAANSRVLTTVLGMIDTLLNAI